MGSEWLGAEVHRQLDTLVGVLTDRPGLLLVVTGAGVSVASGIGTFRDGPDAVWSNDVMTMATRQYFMAEPVNAWVWYLKRFQGLVGARPNAGHRALVELEDWWTRPVGECLVVTQNIDGLHRAAGQRHCIEVHGRVDQVRCIQRGCEHAAPHGALGRPQEALDRFLAAPGADRLPLCPSCGGLLRPHVLWFDETYDSHRSYRAGEVWKAAKDAAVIVFVGTSFAVGVTDQVLRTGLARGAFMASVDPSGFVPHRRVLNVPARAEHFLPALLQVLSASGS